MELSLSTVSHIVKKSVSDFYYVNQTYQWPFRDENWSNRSIAYWTNEVFYTDIDIWL